MPEFQATLIDEDSICQTQFDVTIGFYDIGGDIDWYLISLDAIKDKYPGPTWLTRALPDIKSDRKGDTSTYYYFRWILSWICDHFDDFLVEQCRQELADAYEQGRIKAAETALGDR